MLRKYVAEAIGTFALVFCGTGAIIVNDISNGSLGNNGIAITFGLIVMVMIYAFGSISGAHINPAVSIAFSLTRRFSSRLILPYMLFQFLGATAASALLFALFPDHATLGSTLPHAGIFTAFIFEFILTYLLMLVILLVSQNAMFKPYTAIAVGATVLLEALFAGPICGASMNPARSFAPAIFSANIKVLWIYFLAPILGAITATFHWKWMEKGRTV